MAQYGSHLKDLKMDLGTLAALYTRDQYGSLV
jgi:hypothetical protein